MYMKKLIQIFQALLGLSTLIYTKLVSACQLTLRTVCYWWKKRSQYIQCSIITVFILIPIGFVILFTHDYYENKYGRWEWNDNTLSKEVEVHSFRDYTYRIYNKNTGKYTTPKIGWVSNAQENDSLAVYAISNKRGYINVKTGEIAIDAQLNNYEKAWVFSEGLAAVMKDGKIGFINAQNEVVIPFVYDYSNKCHMCDIGYLFHNGYCIMTHKEGNLGLIDSKGKWIVEPSYDEIWAPHKNGYRIVINEAKYGVIDSLCQLIYPAEYEYVEILSESFVLNKNGKKWQVDLKKNIIQPFLVDATNYLNYPMGYNENGDVQYILSDYESYEVLNRYGILNRKTGQPITPALYSGINMVSKKLFEVQDPESYDWYLLDLNGKIVSKN